MMTDREHRERNARLEQLAVEDALSKANDPSVRQYAASGVMIGKRAATPTFEEFVKASRDTITIEESYAMLYGEKPVVKPKAKISDIVDSINGTTRAIQILLRQRGSTADAKAITDQMKASFTEMGLAHLIDWEDGS